MNTLTLKLEHNGKTYAGEIMTIKNTTLGFEDHGIFSLMLMCEGKGTGVGIGGLCLDTNKKLAGAEVPELDRDEYDRYGTAYGLDLIIQIINTIGVYNWEAVPGKQIVVLHEGEHIWGSRAVGFANLMDPSKVLIFEDHAKPWRDMK